MKIVEMFSHPLSEALGWALLHSIWQGALVAGLVVCGDVLLRRGRPQLRYLVACAALLLMLALPIATTALIFSTPEPASAGPFRPERVLQPFEAVVQPAATAASPADTGTAAAEGAASTAISWQNARGTLERTRPWLLGFWFAGVLFFSLRFLGQCLYAERFKARHSRLAPEAWRARLAALAIRMQVGQPVRLLESSLVPVPTVIGALRPVILVPVSAFTGLSKEQLEAILAHELAHIRRHDYLVNLLQSVIEILLFYHPAVWWLSKRIRILREHLCDDEAVKACGSPLMYAKALAELESLRGPRLALAANGSSLAARVRRLLGLPAPPSSSPRHWLAGVTVMVTSSAWR